MRAARLAAVLLALLCLAGFSTGASGASGTYDEASKLEIYLRSPANPQHVLALDVYPNEGVAVVHAAFFDKRQDERGIAYAIAIPKARFDGSLDLNFPGIGEVVGTVTPIVVVDRWRRQGSVKSDIRANPPGSKGTSPSMSPRATNASTRKRSRHRSPLVAVRHPERGADRVGSSRT
jgi:hypothetical protein